MGSGYMSQKRTAPRRWVGSLWLPFKPTPKRMPSEKGRAPIFAIWVRLGPLFEYSTFAQGTEKDTGSTTGWLPFSQLRGIL